MKHYKHYKDYDDEYPTLAFMDRPVSVWDCGDCVMLIRGTKKYYYNEPLDGIIVAEITGY